MLKFKTKVTEKSIGVCKNDCNTSQNSAKLQNIKCWKQLKERPCKASSTNLYSIILLTVKPKNVLLLSVQITFQLTQALVLFISHQVSVMTTIKLALQTDWLNPAKHPFRSIRMENLRQLSPITKDSTSRMQIKTLLQILKLLADFYQVEQLNIVIHFVGALRHLWFTEVLTVGL